MDSLLRQVASIRDQGMFFGPVDPDRKMPATATRDMSAIAAQLLADEGWSGQEETPVLGPKDLSMNDMAAIVSDVFGHESATSRIRSMHSRRNFCKAGEASRSRRAV